MFKRYGFTNSQLLSIFILVGVLVACEQAPPPKAYTLGLTLFDELDAMQQQQLKRCDLDGKDLERLINLSYRDFDQDFTGGWRAVAKQSGCEIVASRIIDRYIVFSKYINTTNIYLLRWHSGQNLAKMGEYEKARRYFLAFKRPENEDSELWNIYVESTIAFLDKDKSRLEALYKKLSSFPVPIEEKEARRQFLKDNPNISMPDGFIDEPENLAVVRSLVACFSASYKEAYFGDC